MTIARWLLLALMVTPLLSGTVPSAASDTLTPAQAQQALEVLEDAQKRDQLVATLRAIAMAQPKPAPAAAPPEPNSLGAQLLLQLSQWAGRVFEQASETARVVTDAPALWRQSVTRLADPVVRAGLLDAALKLAIVLGCALFAGWLAERASRPAVVALAARAPDDGGGEADPWPALPTDPAQLPGPGHRTGAWRLIGRLPFALARLTLDLFPVGIILGVGNLLPATLVAAPEPVRLVILAAVNGYALCRLIIAVARMLISPASRRLRLLRIADTSAAYLDGWVRRIVYVAVFGAVLAEVAPLRGLDPAAQRVLVRLVALILHAFLVIIVIQCRRAVARDLRAPAGAQGTVAELRNWLARYWHTMAIFLIVATWVVWSTTGGTGLSDLLRSVIVTAAVLILARLAAILALGLLDRVYRLGPDWARAQRYPVWSRRVVSAAIGAATVVTLLQIWGVNAVAWFGSGRLGARLLSALVAIAAAAVAAAVVWETANAAIERRLQRVAQEGRIERLARVQSLLPMLRAALFAAILAVLGLTVLSELGVDIAPLLAGAGIIGIAIGFGAQKLMQDVITGMFLLFENALRVGDAVVVSGLCGTVETLSIRNIWLRAPDGAVNIIPFGSVTSITNTSRGLGNVAVNVTVGYQEDLDRVFEGLREIVAGMRRDPDFAGLIRGDLHLWGVDKVAAAGVTIVGQIECTDAGRWPVQRGFNLRLVKRFRELGIEIASP